MRFGVLLAAALPLAACSGAGVYPDTDLSVVSGFQHEGTSGLITSGGVAHQGQLEFRGHGDLLLVFTEYVKSLREQGWGQPSLKIDPEKATGTLRKDTRTCTLDFVSTQQGGIKAVIKVAGK